MPEANGLWHINDTHVLADRRHRRRRSAVPLRACMCVSWAHAQGLVTGLALAPNGNTAQGGPAAQVSELLVLSDWVRISLAGLLRCAAPPPPPSWTGLAGPAAQARQLTTWPCQVHAPQRNTGAKHRGGSGCWWGMCMHACVPLGPHEP